ncbi:hypothetical protein GCM10027299_03000 [Larkinella ripae]
MPSDGRFPSYLFQLEPGRRGGKSMQEWAFPSYVSCDSWNQAAGAEENAQLKKLVADLSLDKQMLQDVIKKL